MELFIFVLKINIFKGLLKALYNWITSFYEKKLPLSKSFNLINFYWLKFQESAFSCRYMRYRKVNKINKMMRNVRKVQDQEDKKRFCKNRFNYKIKYKTGTYNTFSIFQTEWFKKKIKITSKKLKKISYLLMIDKMYFSLLLKSKY